MVVVGVGEQATRNAWNRWENWIKLLHLGG